MTHTASGWGLSFWAMEEIGRGWMTMTGLRSLLRIALIIALALFLFVILGFAAYSIFLFAKWLVENAASL